jgi:hypothetical protein
MRTKSILTLLLTSLFATFGLHAAKKNTPVWASLDAANIPESVKIQGEYLGQIKGGGKIGAQVIALGGDNYQAVLLPGGLPGAGWDGKNKILLDGSKKDGGLLFHATDGKGKGYLQDDPAKFSATRKNPPNGNKAYSGVISEGALQGKTDDGKSLELRRVIRTSPTLGMKAPKGAKVLFDGTSKDAFQGGRIDEKTKFLNTDGRDIRTTDKLTNYQMHIEFMLPYRPDARGQGRGNSGVYQVDMYEVQILDSFGLDGLDNECGGVYKKANSLVNMCLPPLQWQTYDVDFTNAVAEGGKKTRNARMTLRHNGVVIHDDLDINGKTGGSRRDPEGTPGQIKFQGHGNPLQFRNIWVVIK